MDAMKNKISGAFPVVFSLAANSDYSQFVVASRPAVAMRNNWVGVGKRLQQATIQVGKDVKKISISPTGS